MASDEDEEWLLSHDIRCVLSRISDPSPAFYLHSRVRYARAHKRNGKKVRLKLNGGNKGRALHFRSRCERLSSEESLEKSTCDALIRGTLENLQLIARVKTPLSSTRSS